MSQKPPDFVAGQDKPPLVPSGTQIVDGMKVKAEMGLYNSLVDVFADFMNLINSVNHTANARIEKDHKAFFWFFVLGILFAYVGIFFTLYNMGIILGFEQYLVIIGSFAVSIVTGFIMSKFKEIIPTMIDPLNTIKDIVNKLSKTQTK